MTTVKSFQTGNGNSKTIVPKEDSQNVRFWESEYTNCINKNNPRSVIGYSHLEQSVDLMGKSLKK